MSNPQVITVRVPLDLKERISNMAHDQGVSINQFINYTLTEKVTALEAEHFFADFVKGKSKKEILSDFDAVMTKLDKRQSNEPLPDWDKLPE